MKVYLTIIFLFIASLVKPCGWNPDNDLYFFYNLFNQTNISTKAYHSFLRDDYHAFYYTDQEKSVPNVGNLNLWKEILPEWTLIDLSAALLTESEDDFENIWRDRKSKIEVRAKKYIEYARKCSDYFEYRHGPSWDYEEILKEYPIDPTSLLKEGKKLFNAEKDKQLKLRYGYQVVRIFHYSKRYRDAVVFFSTQIESQFKKNEIYYYALDQIAGCYYSLENYEKAAYLFLNVFDQSVDRKVSAFTSYNFCTNNEAEGKAFFDGIADETAFITLKSIRGFSDEISGIKELIEIAPADKKLELLFMRALNNLERGIWPTRIGTGSRTLPTIEDRELERLDELSEIADNVYSISEITNKDFWLISSSYLSFLYGDLIQAKNKLSQIKDIAFNDQKEILSHIYEVFTWAYITKEREIYLAPILNDVIDEVSLNNWDLMLPSWKYLIMDQVAHLYYKNETIGKAFLIHNRIEAINRLSSLALIDDLILFVDRGGKNDFEKLLLKRTSNISYGTAANDYLIFVKGLYYLQQGDPQSAYAYLNNSSLDYVNEEDLHLGKFVFIRIFSNNIKECFNCPDSDVMVDSVFLASPFSFMKTKFSKAELAHYLIKLDSITQDDTQWKRKLAHYLLGNYYFNASNTGYYRGTLSGQSHCCSYRYFFSKYSSHKLAEDLINDNIGFNLFDIEDHYKAHYGFSTIAYEHYEQVISNSSDNELNARCHYLMAKCELNTMYNEEKEYYYGYDGSLTSVTKRYKKSFKKLQENYDETEFYKMIIKDCSFFKYYCSL